MIDLTVTEAYDQTLQLDTIKEEDLSHLITRSSLLEPLPIRSVGLITDIIYGDIYPLLPEINFGEVPSLEKEEPSQIVQQARAFTHEQVKGCQSGTFTPRPKTYLRRRRNTNEKGILWITQFG